MSVLNKKDFIEVNKNWIQEYFILEAHDLEQLTDIDKIIADSIKMHFIVENWKVVKI